MYIILHKCFFLIDLLLWCQITEGLFDKRVNLGENVTLDCQIDVKEMFWVFQKLTDAPVLILRTFSTESTVSHILEERFRNKYSSLTLSRLFISSITIDEIGVYYCIKRDSTTIKFSNGTRLYITEDKSQTKPNESHYQTTQEALIVLYIILNIMMFSAVIALFQIKLQLCKKRQQQNEELEKIFCTSAAEFSEVEFRLFQPNNNTFAPFQNPMTKTRRI